MIDVVIATWPNHAERLTYFRSVLASLRTYLSASEHTLRYVVSSESERDPACPWYGAELEQLCRAEEIPLHWHQGPASLGGGMNAALRCCAAPYILLVQDDYKLLRPLDLSKSVKLMEAHREIDLIRYRWVVRRDGTRQTEFTGKEIDGFREIDLNGFWPYGDDPHLRRQTFHEKFGWYYEDGHTSEGKMLRRLQSDRAVIYAAPGTHYFLNIGHVPSVPSHKETRPGRKR